MNGEVTAHEVTWDGKNLAVIQIIPFPRRNGVPTWDVDRDWNLAIDHLEIPAGAELVYEIYNGTAIRWYFAP